MQYYNESTEEDDGFEIVAEMYTSMEYDWSNFGLFKDRDGKLYTAGDSGCSCNGPWEYRPDFTPVESVQAAIREASSLVRENDEDYYGYSQQDFEDFKRQALAL